MTVRGTEIARKKEKFDLKKIYQLWLSAGNFRCSSVLLRVEKWPGKLSSREAVDDETANSNIGNVES